MANDRINDFRAAATHGVNAFLWSRLQEDLGWDKNDYGGLIPITTPQQQQEFNDLDLPYIVYNYKINTTSTSYALKQESAIYVIYGNGPNADSSVRETLHLLEYYFSSMDDSARVVSEYIWSLPDDSPFRKFHYQSIIPRGFSGAAPPDQEGGIMDAQANIDIVYTRDSTLDRFTILP